MDYVEHELMLREVIALEQISESLKGINLALSSLAISGISNGVPPHIYTGADAIVNAYPRFTDFKEVFDNEERA